MLLDVMLQEDENEINYRNYAKLKEEAHRTENTGRK